MSGHRVTNSNKHTAQKTCPLCHAPNHCAIAAGAPAASCWCQKTVISQQALASLPEDARNTACICATCGSTAEGVSRAR